MTLIYELLKYPLGQAVVLTFFWFGVAAVVCTVVDVIYSEWQAFKKLCRDYKRMKARKASE